jgi:DNA invertase Pin-like site-specific DNA recombinase
VAALLAARAVYAARDDALRIARAPLNFHHHLGRKQFERAMIQERVRAGLKRAVAEGTKLGRPKIDGKTERAIQADLGKKDRPGLQKLAAIHGVGVGTVQRIAGEMAAT